MRVSLVDVVASGHIWVWRSRAVTGAVIERLIPPRTATRLTLVMTNMAAPDCDHCNNPPRYGPKHSRPAHSNTS